MGKYWFRNFPAGVSEKDYPRGMLICLRPLPNQNKFCELLDKVSEIDRQIKSFWKGIELIEKREKEEQDLFDDVMRKRGFQWISVLNAVFLWLRGILVLIAKKRQKKI